MLYWHSCKLAGFLRLWSDLHKLTLHAYVFSGSASATRIAPAIAFIVNGQATKGRVYSGGGFYGGYLIAFNPGLTHQPTLPRE